MFWCNGGRALLGNRCHRDRLLWGAAVGGSDITLCCVWGGVVAGRHRNIRIHKPNFPDVACTVAQDASRDASVQWDTTGIAVAFLVGF